MLSVLLSYTLLIMICIPSFPFISIIPSELFRSSCLYFSGTSCFFIAGANFLDGRLVLGLGAALGGGAGVCFAAGCAFGFLGVARFTRGGARRSGLAGTPTRTSVIVSDAREPSSSAV